MEIINLKDEPVLLSLLANWHHNEWSYLNPSLSLEARIQKMQSYLSDEIIPSTFVARNEDTVLGSSALVEHDMDTNTHLSPWLASVYVHPAYRNKGIGSKIVLYTMAQAKANNINKLYLFTPDRVHFYTRLGWNVLGTEEYHGTSITIMETILDGQQES